MAALLGVSLDLAKLTLWPTIGLIKKRFKLSPSTELRPAYLIIKISDTDTSQISARYFPCSDTPIWLAQVIFQIERRTQVGTFFDVVGFRKR
jgi:hypothetical protein